MDAGISAHSNHYELSARSIFVFFSVRVAVISPLVIKLNDAEEFGKGDFAVRGIVICAVIRFQPKFFHYFPFVSHAD